MRYHAEAVPVMMDTLLKCLPESDEAAAAFDVVLGDCEELLNAASFAQSRLLYKQRLFAQHVGRLTAGFHHPDAAPASRARHLLALSHMLRHVPRQVLVEQVEAILPLLIQSLDADEAREELLFLSSMQTLQALHVVPR